MNLINVHSNYSLLQGTIPVESLIQSAKNRKLTSLALTDTNGMYGLIKFAKLAEQEKIKPILGTTITDPKNGNQSVTLIAKNNNGYSSLCKIITARKLDENFSLEKILKNYLPDLFLITSSIEVLRKIPAHDNVYAELVSTKLTKKIAKELFEFSLQKKFKYVASHPVYFLGESDFMIHKVLRAISLRKTISNLEESDLLNPEYYYPDEKKYVKKWSSIPEAISNASFIYNNSNVDLRIGEYKFPQYPVSENESVYSLLHKLAFEGLNRRYKNISKQIKDRLNYELDVIVKLNFVDYFLVVWDIVTEAKRRGMMMIGRGSAANSLVSYCLGFTEVDPVKYDLYFERFLNLGRISPPDVDLDFSWKERDEIIKYVFDKYGYERVAMISTTVTFRARSAFREVAKAFGISDREVSRYSKFIPWTNAANLPNITKLYPESRNLNFESEPWKTIVNIATRIANFPRFLGIHPGGIVISPGKITDYTALEYAKNKGLGLIVTQPDMYSIEDLGLVKIDLLSQRSLGVLRDSLRLIKNTSEI